MILFSFSSISDVADALVAWTHAEELAEVADADILSVYVAG